MSESDDRQERLREAVARCLYEMEERGEDALESACEAHPDLAEDIRRRIEQLAGMGILDGELHEAETNSEGFPSRLGEFRLIRRLGVGGMGVVYRATEESLGREVALKVVRPDHLYFPQARERFVREVRSIAKLQHPGIVPVYSVGEESGIPYFAMELVHGLSLADALTALARHRPVELDGVRLASVLSLADHETHAEAEWFADDWIRTCFRLVLQIAEALEHAHQRQIIHRDIKPSNLMLTPDGRVRLLDFGLASSSGAPRITKTGALVGSLPYMAPETLEGDRDSADQRTDIYGLGVTLYEMLTLRLPYQDQDWDSTRRKILGGESLAPRKLNPKVGWEAETVCLTAMERDPSRRYQSATDLAQDLRNVLERRPIQARRVGMSLRTRRWIQRHPTASVATALAFLLVVVGPLVFAWQATRNLRRVEHQKELADAAREDAEHQQSLAMAAETAAVWAQQAAELAKEEAERARGEAEQKRDEAHANLQTALAAVDQFLKRVGKEQLKDIPLMEGLRRELLEDALSFYQQFYERNADDPQITTMTVEALKQVSLIHRLLGDPVSGAETEKQRIRVLQNSLDQYPGDPTIRLELANAFNTLAGHDEFAGNVAVALEGFAKSAEVLRGLIEDSDHDEYRYQLAIALQNLGDLHIGTGDTWSGLDELTEGRQLLEDLLERRPTNEPYREALGGILYSTGSTLDVLGQQDESFQAFLESLENYESLLEDDPTDAERRRNVAHGRGRIGRLLWGRGETEEGIDYLWQAIDEQKLLVEEFPTATPYRWDLGMALMNLGASLSEDEQYEEAEEILEEARAIQEQLVDDFPEVDNYQHELSGTLNNLGRVVIFQDRVDEGLEMVLEAIDLQEAALEVRPQHPRYQIFLRNQYNLLAYAYLELGEDQDSADAALTSVEISGFDAEWMYLMAGIISLCCHVAEERGDQVSASDHAQQVIELLEGAEAKGYDVVGGLPQDSAFDHFRHREEYRAFLRSSSTR